MGYVTDGHSHMHSGLFLTKKCLTENNGSLAQLSFNRILTTQTDTSRLIILVTSPLRILHYTPRSNRKGKRGLDMATDLNPRAPRRIVRNQAELDIWFRTYNLTFQDPTRFATTLSELFDGIMELERQGQSANQLFTQSGYNTILRILQEIEILPDHRHREDAANIIVEIGRRRNGEPPLRLISRPLNAPPPPRSQAQMDMDGTLRMPLEDSEMDLRVPPYGPDSGLPVPWIRLRENNLPPPEQSEINLQVAYQLSQSFTLTSNARDSIENILLAGTNGRGLDPPTYLDNPAELVLEMPENLRFLDDPIGVVDDALYDQTQWPKLDIFDLRRGSAANYGPLQESDYIYQFFLLVREILCLPEIARKYVIILRAYPTRYQNDTPEEFVDEPAPTVEEG